jgi:hypothetical protein
MQYEQKTAKIFENLLGPLILEESLDRNSLRFLINEALDAKTVSEMVSYIRLSKKSLIAFQKASVNLNSKVKKDKPDLSPLNEYISKFDEFLNKHLERLNNLDDKDEKKIRAISASALKSITTYVSMLDTLNDAVGMVMDKFEPENPNRTLEDQGKKQSKNYQKEVEDKDRLTFAKVMARSMGAEKAGMFSGISSKLKGLFSKLPQPPQADEAIWGSLFYTIMRSKKSEVDAYLSAIEGSKNEIKGSIDKMQAAIDAKASGEESPEESKGGTDLSSKVKNLTPEQQAKVDTYIKKRLKVAESFNHHQDLQRLNELAGLPSDKKLL